MKNLRLLRTALILPVLWLSLLWAVTDPARSQTTAASADTSARSPGRERFGVFGSLDIELHHSDFTTLPGVPSCCSHFPSGSGTGFSVGVLYEHMLSGTWFLGGRGGFEYVPARFRDREATTFIVAGHATDGELAYTLDAGYHAVSLQPLLGYRLYQSGRYAISAQAGLGLSARTGSSASQFEEISAPTDIGRYTSTDSPTRNEYAGPIPNATSFMMDARLGVRMEVAVNRSRTIVVAPELWYSIGLTPVIRSTTWSVDAVRLGLSVSFVPQSARPDTAGAFPVTRVEP